jgi:hypothetical protein
MKFSIKSSMLLTGFLLAGAIGTGKTTISYQLVRYLHSLRIKSICIDIRRDTRHLIRKIPILVLKFPDTYLKWNILGPPPGVDKKTWQMSVIRQFSETTYIAEAGESLLQESLEKLNHKIENVNFIDLYNYIKSSSKIVKGYRRSNWIATDLNRMASFIRLFYNMLNTELGLPLHELADSHNICIELDQAGQFQSFFASLIPSYLYHYRLANNLRGNQIRNAIFLDEANIVLSEALIKRHTIMGEPTILSIIRLGREFGLAMICFTNHPSALDNTIKAQSGIKIMLRLGHHPDILDFGRSMGLTKEQMDCIIDAPPGVGIVKVSGIRPFLCQFENFEIEKNITDKEVEENNLRIVKATKYEKYFNTLSTERTHIPTPRTEKEKAQNGEIKPEVKAFLYNIINLPLKSISERYKILGLSASKGNSIVKKLIRNNLCKKEKINLGYRGGVKSFLVITDQGYRILNVAPKQFSRGTTFKHWFWQTTISSHLNSLENAKAQVERNLRGKFIDILVENLEMYKTIAIEISITSTSENEKNNIIKDIEAGAGIVIVACKKEKIAAMNEMRKSLDNQIREKTKIIPLPELLKIKDIEDLVKVK